MPCPSYGESVASGDRDIFWSSYFRLLAAENGLKRLTIASKKCSLKANKIGIIVLDAQTSAIGRYDKKAKASDRS